MEINIHTEDLSKTKIYEIYTDGSHRDGEASWAFVVICENEKIYEDSGPVFSQEAIDQLWNIAGEIKAVVQAIEWAKENKVQVTLIPDYKGIQGWAENWKTKNQWTKSYSIYIKRNKQIITEFKYVKGHSGNIWNDYVDKLAFQQLNEKENLNG